MISTRLHGAIDYAVAGLLGAAAASGLTGRTTRRLLAGTGAYHASYATMTDYEAGLVPLVTMRQHLLLDTAGAATLCIAGLLTRERPRDRALLLGIGLLELGVIAASDVQRSGPRAEGPVYQPVDVAKPVANGVWIVDSGPLRVAGLPLPVRMTVIRLPDGSLILHSPTRYTERLRHDLERLGPIRYLVAPNFAHWMYVRDWQRACPKALTLAAPGLRERGPVKRAGLRIDDVLSDQPPLAWRDAVDLVPVPGAAGFVEVALFHRPTRTLVLTDLVQNIEQRRMPLLPRLALWAAGSTAPDGRAPIQLRVLLSLARRRSAPAARRLIALAPERVIFAHGKWHDRDGTAALRRSLAWLTG